MKYFSHLAVLFSLCFAFNGTAIKAADNKMDEDKIEVVNLTVYPAPIPRPAMKYHLLPRLSEQTPGNAAFLYYPIFSDIDRENGIRDALSKDLKDEKEREKYYTNADKLSNWLDKPLSETPKDEVRKLLDDVPPLWLEYAEMASKCTQCDWGLLARGNINNPFDIPLPELQPARSLARILEMKARLAMIEGKPEDALKTLQMGFALSQHIGKGKQPIANYLVGLAIASVMREQLVDLCQLKDAPNLYWSLANLPHPFLNSHDAIDWEELAVERLLRELQEARKGQHSPEQWQKLWEGLVERINDASPRFADYTKIQKKEIYDAIDAKKMLEEYYPIARDYLIKLGWPKKEIQSMAPAHVTLLYGAEIWEKMYDDYTKWLGTNSSQWPNNYGLRDHFNNELLKKYGQNPLSNFLPVIGAIARSQARTDRDFDSLRTIEAIRLYAYSHDDKLPGSLDDIKEVPILPNPMTGKPFSYHLEGDTAVLQAVGDTRINYEYRIKIAK